MNSHSTFFQKGRIFSQEHRRNISEAKKGIPVSEEVKKKISKSVSKLWEDPEYRERQTKVLQENAKKRIGKPLDPEIGKKISATNKGRIITSEWRKNMSVAAKRKYANGFKHPMLGKHHSEKTKKILSEKNSGWHHTEEARRKISLSQIGRPGGMLGKQHSEKTKEKISKTRTGISYVSDKGKEKLRIKRLNQIFPKKDTKPEKILQRVLMERGILFEKHAALLGQPDIFIPNKKLCVFTDGNFWHGNPAIYKSDYVIRRKPNFITAKDKQEKDRRINENLKNQGFTVLRFWESEINQDIEKCVEKILLEINKIHN